MQHSSTAIGDTEQAAGSVLARLRAQRPRVHCITNSVAQNFTANALLALGCVPSMTLSVEEVGVFVAGAQALLVNLGTLDAARRQAVDIALTAAAENDVPWVRDPVLVDRSAPRAALARDLVAGGPRVLRLNGAEFSTLAGNAPSPQTLAAFARENRLVVALSGETDTIADGARRSRVGNGHVLMARVTAMGCAASALVAASLAVETDAFAATTAALTIMGVAGEIAAEKAEGPGTFAAAIIDALFALDGAVLERRARVT